ncbi:MAG: hypothetical protein GC184_00925 [Rhizobiales bacterium]|nr:hypothetical protein [Hyphomicrobiales bacterium]
MTDDAGKATRRAAEMKRAADRLNPHATFSLIGMSDPSRLPDMARALDLLPRGAMLILRPAGHIAPAVLRNLHRKARAKNCLLLVSASGERGSFPLADGRHLPERMAFRPYGNQKIICAATHSEAALYAAARAGAQMVLISPVFKTRSHTGSKAIGVTRLARLTHIANALGLLAFALGGIETPAHVRRLTGTGVDGVAGISWLQA